MVMAVRRNQLGFGARRLVATCSVKSEASALAAMRQVHTYYAVGALVLYSDAAAFWPRSLAALVVGAFPQAMLQCDEVFALEEGDIGVPNCLVNVINNGESDGKPLPQVRLLNQFGDAGQRCSAS